MPLVTVWKLFLVTADTTGLLTNDQVLGSKGKGRYRVWALAAAAADATITINDGNNDVVAAAPIPVGAAAVTYPRLSRADDFYWDVNYQGAGPTLPINIADGTNAEIEVLVEYLG